MQTRYGIGFIVMSVIGVACVVSMSMNGVSPPSPSPTITLPTIHVEPQADDAPSVDPVATEVVSELKLKQWYVIESSVELLSDQYPDDALDIAAGKGPIQTRGEFADNPGVIETRTFKQTNVYFITASKVGSVRLVLVPAGAKSKSEWVHQTINVTEGTAPNPPPIVVRDDPLTKAQTAQRAAEIAMLRELALDTSPNTQQKLDKVVGLRDAIRLQTQSVYTDALAEAVFANTLPKLADEIEGKKE